MYFFTYFVVMKRLTKEDWLGEGLKILQEFAQNKIRILYLCERLGVTRGSFYHHFKSIDEFISELLKKWENDNTLMLIEVSSQEVSGKEQLKKLGEMTMSSNKAVEVAIRSWSLYNSVVKEYLDKVDKIRLAYLVTIFKQAGLPQEVAEKRAQVDYALLVGMQHLFPDMSIEAMTELYQMTVQ